MTTDSVVYILGSGVIASLSGSVAYLFKLVLDNEKEFQAELHECQEDRKKLWDEIAKLKYTLMNRKPGIES